tara:strand:+ start:1181 stop:1588 length:408 start_codon:yes stop_codon:yes gene_type:complete
MRALLTFLTVVSFFFMSVPAQAADKKESSGAEFVKLDPLILPIIDTNGVQQIVSLVVAIEVSGVNNAEKVKTMSPKLTDAYIQDMYGVLNEQVALKGGVIQVSVIKERLMHVTEDIMGEDIVSDVLLQVVQQRPI